jgi:hypothetical protein
MLQRLLEARHGLAPPLHVDEELKTAEDSVASAKIAQSSLNFISS